MGHDPARPQKTARGTQAFLCALSLAAFALSAGSAGAVDGEVLISQSKANAGGITPGDAPGFPVTLNDPYAGGSIIARHGQPAQRVHALQLEFDRSLYLDRDGQRAGPGFDRIATLLESLAAGLGHALLDGQLRDAAE